MRTATTPSATTPRGPTRSRLLATGLLVGVLSGVAGCDGASSVTVDTVPCDVTDMTLSGTTWVYLEAMPDRTNKANPAARMQWHEEGGVQKVRYNVKNPFEMHDYSCKKVNRKGDDGIEVFREWACKEDAKPVDWCISLEVGEQGTCDVAKLKELGAEQPDAELAKAVKEGRAEVAKFRADAAQWADYSRNRNFLGNKLQGLVDAHMNDRCQLLVTDRYMTVYQGKKTIDSNPVGTNPFVKVEDPGYYWGKCDDGYYWVDLPGEVPKDLGQIPEKQMRRFDLGDVVNYYYLGNTANKAEKGCTYSMDVYKQWLPFKKDLPITVEDEKSKLLRWKFSYAWQRDELEGLMAQPWLAQGFGAAPLGILQAERYKTCGDKPREKIDVICNNTFLMPPGPAGDPE